MLRSLVGSEMCIRDRYREYYEGRGMPVSILMSRIATSAMNVPSAFVPILSDDPQLVYPDEHSRLILEKVAAARGDAPSALDGFFDINVEKAKWNEFCKFKKAAILEHPATCLVCEDYYAEFDKVDQHGNVILSGLSSGGESSTTAAPMTDRINFSSALEARIRAGIEGLFPEAAYVWNRNPCLLYTSDAADEEDSVDLGGRRIIKKKKKVS
eukprot:TRINITY_DN57178_c0_g1_i1.p1 TRINITY_DN57178_c0_g1~~TRINITY_DN57178_c0_g1_i1.p1  ORF type:complete len:212 (-),score=64.24 TRINITY_DN57178_c0_g1_i1:72-707(-)